LAVTIPPPVEAGRWYENYDHAVRLIESTGCSRPAIGLLEGAIRERPDPSAKAKTISIQIIKYDPYFWLAKAYAACGDASAAKEALSKSRRAGVVDEGQLAQVEAQLAPAAPVAPPFPNSLTPKPPEVAALRGLERLSCNGVELTGIPAGSTFESTAGVARLGRRLLPLPPGVWRVTNDDQESVEVGVDLSVDQAIELLSSWTQAGATLRCTGTFPIQNLSIAAACLLLAQSGNVSREFEETARRSVEAIAALRASAHEAEMNRLLLALESASSL
jgi:hypothetical protein